MKYEEVYCAADHITRTLDEVVYIYKNNPEMYAKTLDKQMFCPGCQKVHIAYADAKRPYLRGFPNEIHDEDCLYKKEELSQVEVEGLINDQAGRDEIKSQMNRLLIQFLRNDRTTNGGTPGSRGEKTGNTGTENKRVWQVRNVIPRKQINAPFHEDDYGVDKFFYGRANIKWEKNTREPGKMKLLVWGVTTKKLICKLNVTSAVYGHIPADNKNPIEYEAFVIFLCSLSKPKEISTWSKGTLARSDYLSITKIRKPDK